MTHRAQCGGHLRLRAAGRLEAPSRLRTPPCAGDQREQGQPIFGLQIGSKL